MTDDLAKTHYDGTFFDAMEAGALSSAAAVLPIVLELIAPRSIVDVGCGRGAWLRVAAELGVPQVAGIDGEYVDRRNLWTPAEQFRAEDLRSPFQTGNCYDLALCLEVAEHLPKSAAGPLVAAPVSAAPVVLFSAAIPGQPGTRHINPRFPEYWSKGFAEHGYVALDAVRPAISWDRRVEPWYRQNMILYVARSYYEGSPRLRWYPPIEDPEELLPWEYGGIWRGRVRWRGPLSVLRILIARALGRELAAGRSAIFQSLTGATLCRR